MVRRLSADFGCRRMGLGLHYGTGPFAASLEYGRLLNGSKVPPSANSAAPQRGDDRPYVDVTWRFQAPRAD